MNKEPAWHTLISLRRAARGIPLALGIRAGAPVQESVITDPRLY
jgi:hypothetical protein